MSPEVRQVQRFEKQPRINYFIVDLSNDAPLNTHQFYDAVRQVVDDPDREGAMSVKFIVYDDKLVVFPAWLYFKEANELIFDESNITGKLRCIGDMRLEGGRRKILKVPGHAMEDSGLRMQDSDDYRDHVLLEKLGSDFTLE